MVLKAADYVARAATLNNGPYEFVRVDGDGVLLRCGSHGEFRLSLSSFRNGSGCVACSRQRRQQLDVESVARTHLALLGRFAVTHGGRYDYSKFEYTSPKVKVCIICREHGEFFQYAYNHAKGVGCPLCANKTRWASRPRSQLSEEDRKLRRAAAILRYDSKKETRQARADYRAANRERQRELGREWYLLNKERVKQAASDYALRNPEKVAVWKRASKARMWDKEKSYVRVAQATPKWADMGAIEAIYAECAAITKSTGVRHHVDHIEPLRGFDRCGLHVAENLRILPAVDNIAKGNDAEDGTRRREYWESFSPEEITAYIEEIFRSYRVSGFPYHEVPDASQIAKGVIVARNYLAGLSEGELKLTSHCSVLATAHFPHIHGVKVGRARAPEEVFFDDASFRKAIRTLLERNDYISDRAIRTAVGIYGGARVASNFPPIIAAQLYARYAGEGAVVFDPCAGWGGRLMGAAIADNVRKYVGFDASSKTVEGLAQLAYAVASFVDADVCHGAAEDMVLDFPVDMVLTSPPYFDHERYSADPEQSFLRYKTPQDWVSGFLEPMLCNATRVLAPGGAVCINIADVPTHNTLTSDTVLILSKLGLRHETTLQLPLRSIDAKKGARSEPIFVFRKPLDLS